MAYEATYAPGANDVEAEQLKRAAAYAQALRDQSMNSGPAGEMVSGHYVPTFNGLKGLGQAMIARNMEGGISERQKALAEAITSQRNKEMGSFLEKFDGKPERIASGPAPEGQNQDGGYKVPAIAPNMRGAYAEALASSDPMLRQLGAQVFGQLPQMEAQAQERIDARNFRQSESEAARAARAEELRMRSEDARTSQAERLQAQKELRQMQIDAQRDMQRMIIASRPAPAEKQAQIIQTADGPMQLVGGKAAPILSVADGKPVKMPANNRASGPMSATLQKELLEQDDAVNSGKSVIGTLNSALGLNDKSYSGYGAGARATLRSNLPGASPEADNTIVLNNMMQGQALESLKSTFGAAPTEGERKILLELQASADKTPEVRKQILQRAINAAERRTKLAQERAKSIRNGSYLTDGPDASIEPAGPSPKPANVSNW